MTGLLTLIGSGEISERMLNVHRDLLARLAEPRLAFLDTPAGFQLDAAELGAAAAAYFEKHFSRPVEIVEYRSARRAAPQQTARAVQQLAAANYIMAGPGSPTHAIRHWGGSPVFSKLVERFHGGAQVVFASAAAIALSRWALPVYEIYKVGADPFWADGLDLLGPLGFELAILPHFNNQEGRIYDTSCCFIGRPRLLELEKQLPATAVILGIDENTACTIDFTARSVKAAGAGRITVRHQGGERHYLAGTVFDLVRLTPAHALDAPPTPAAAPATARAAAPAQGRLHVPARARQWAAQRAQLRAEKKFAEADALRDRIAEAGYAVKDSLNGPTFSRIEYRDSNAVPSRLEEPDALEWSVNLLAGPGGGSREEIVRAASSALHWSEGLKIEVVIVDNASTDGAAEAVADLAADDPHRRVRPIFMASDLGEGAGRNAGLRASRGRLVVLLGGHMEITGDIFTPLAAALADETIGATGSNGLISRDLFAFEPSPWDEADAIEFYLFAFRRAVLRTVGLLDEKFVFYRNLDLDWSLAFKDKGLRLVTTPGLPLAVHEHPFLRMDPDERERLSKKNYRRFLNKWRDRKDLLLASRSL